MLNVFVIKSSKLYGRVCCDASSGGFFFGILELYLWYNHITYVSNDCGRGTRSCVLYVSLLYYYHSHFGVVVGMMMRCFPVSSYVCVNLFYVCIVFLQWQCLFLGRILLLIFGCVALSWMVV